MFISAKNVSSKKKNQSIEFRRAAFHPKTYSMNNNSYYSRQHLKTSVNYPDRFAEITFHSYYVVFVFKTIFLFVFKSSFEHCAKLQK